MITAPSQGFRTGLDIQFIATPYPARDGWSVATGKRMAKKRRNQARHRNATKGK